MALSKKISDMIAARSRFRAYFARLLVCRKPSISRKAKMGKAIRPTVRVRVTERAVPCSTTLLKWSMNIAAQAMSFR